MDIKDLNKSQLILLAILLSFVVSIATGITTVTLMEQAPSSVTVPITRIVRETVDKVAPTVTQPALSPDQQQLLEELKAIKPLTVTLFLKGDTADKDKVLGTGLFLGDNKVVIASLIPPAGDGQTYVVKSVLGEQNVSSTTQENDFTVVELEQADTTPPSTTTTTTGDTGDTTSTTSTNTSPAPTSTTPSVQ